jgi:predicted Zn-ribbon and HTH transcriptional regulator
MLIGKKPRVLNRIKHAKSVVLNGQQLFLKECAKCGIEFYATEKQTRCSECIVNRLRRAS